MSDYGVSLRHDGWQYEAPPSASEQDAIDAEASVAHEEALRMAGERLFVLVKPDGSRSGVNTYSAISRLAGHYGGRIERVQ